MHVCGVGSERSPMVSTRDRVLVQRAQVPFVRCLRPLPARRTTPFRATRQRLCDVT